MLFRLMISVIKLKNKKADYDTDIKEIVDKIRDHDKLLITVINFQVQYLMKY